MTPFTQVDDENAHGVVPEMHQDPVLLGCHSLLPQAVYHDSHQLHSNEAHCCLQVLWQAAGMHW